MLFNDRNEIVQDIKQRAILVGINSGRRDDIPIEESMEELKELTRAAGAEVVDIVIQNKAKIDPAYFIGKGKAEEIKIMCTAYDVDTIIFNDELSASQMRNLEGILEVAIIDRTTLILDIFARRAETKEAKLQVEIAQLRYRLPRLVGLGRSLSRTGAGIGTRGPGEQKLELDRRRILDRISDIKKQIEEVKKNRDIQRAKRNKLQIPVVSLVGYTNAGKSTLMNKLLDLSLEQSESKKVYSEDLLFATLDTFHRKIVLDDKKEFILTDTVGFVSKLPHHLVDAFKSTLEEVVESDLLIHVVDSCNENFEMQIKVTNEVLKDLGALNKPMIYAFNKCDNGIRNTLAKTKDSVFISALTGYGIENLTQIIKEHLFKDMIKCKMLIPYEKGDIYSYLHENTKVYNIKYEANGTYLEVELNEANYNRYKQYIIEA
ncbi:GTPase HflX [Paramaledivibacter caminithermalis]|jgi:GTP-binding protein HflX|uniref:GTPase HflX n=1 Tax=Paramaledivibacter caminithermalis (strain DSM 15212 / CIP 107654 / DViRD3) TaxID=1121301 RepID=A0A1M6PD40_PARC5|nr:GTPase HflX [Paramaledivibacter caminithermalis]SHK05800.1 GTP-binding protein HflX [Paramaledivibacter caminithermalis DSM 15212]